MGGGNTCLKALGGGDVKLLAAASIWFDLHGGLLLLIYTSMCGGLLGLALIIGRRLVPAGVQQRITWPALKPRGPIPYGIAIAAGAALVMIVQGPNPPAYKTVLELPLLGR